jgi:hypothetical protein
MKEEVATPTIDKTSLHADTRMPYRERARTNDNSGGTVNTPFFDRLLHVYYTDAR